MSHYTIYAHYMHNYMHTHAHTLNFTISKPNCQRLPQLIGQLQLNVLACVLLLLMHHQPDNKTHNPSTDRLYHYGRVCWHMMRRAVTCILAFHSLVQERPV